MAARLTVALLAALLGGCLFGGSARTPSGVVERFYAKRIDLQIGGAPSPDELEAIAPYLTPELDRLLEDAWTMREREAAATPDEKPPFADGDLFSSLFEGPTAFRVVREEPKGDAHRVAVRFTSRHGNESVSWQDTVVVVPDGEGWAIADVEYDGSWKFANKGTLRTNLERALARPPAACQTLVPTRWVVTGHTAPGVSAMSAAEANAWNGAVLALARSRVTFRDDVCASPYFTTREMPRPEFAAAFRVSADTLRLPPGAVCVTEIACGDEPPMPSSLLVHGRDELLLLWDGVWFRAAREGPQ